MKALFVVLLMLAAFGVAGTMDYNDAVTAAPGSTPCRPPESHEVLHAIVVDGVVQCHYLNRSKQ